MTLIALVLSVLMAVLGAYGVIAPGRLQSIVRSFDSRRGHFAAAAIRVVYGVALVFAAPGSRAPLLIWILGMVVFVAGLITVALRFDRFSRLMNWWLRQGLGLVRGWAFIAMVFGAYLAYVLWPWGRGPLV